MRDKKWAVGSRSDNFGALFKNGKNSAQKKQKTEVNNFNFLTEKKSNGKARQPDLRVQSWREEKNEKMSKIFL